MTEIPEHLLARSRERRAALGLGGDDAGGTAAPAAGASAAPVAASAAPAPAPAAAPPAPPKPPKPDLPWVAAAKRRRKVPAFAQVLLVSLPLWALIFAFTNDAPTSDELTPLAQGSEVYTTNCASCHGGDGAGSGANPALADGVVLAMFPDPAEQVRWVFLGSDDWKAEEGNTFGAANKAVSGGMPGWSSLSGEDLLTVVLHERSALSDEEFNLADWEPILEDPILADKQAEFQEVLDAWGNEPPVE